MGEWWVPSWAELQQAVFSVSWKRYSALEGMESRRKGGCAATTPLQYFPSFMHSLLPLVSL